MTSPKYDFTFKPPPFFHSTLQSGKKKETFSPFWSCALISVAVVVKRLVIWVGVLVMCCVTVAIMKYFHTHSPPGVRSESERKLWLLTLSTPPSFSIANKADRDRLSVSTPVQIICLCLPLPFLFTPYSLWLSFTSHSKVLYWPDSLLRH